MTYLIGLGAENDPNRIALVTCAGWNIPNSRRPLPRTPELLRAAYEMHRDAHPTLKLRSLSADYNCVGLVFASRRTAVDVEHLKRILQEDGYRQIPPKEAMIGDVVTYSDGNDYYAHVGIIVRCDANLFAANFAVTVLSQWGADGEYLHDVDDVGPTWLAKPRRFWTERKL